MEEEVKFRCVTINIFLGIIFAAVIEINGISLEINYCYDFASMRSNINYDIEGRSKPHDIDSGSFTVYNSCTCTSNKKYCICKKEIGKICLKDYHVNFRRAEYLLKEKMWEMREKFSKLMESKNLTFADLFDNPRIMIVWLDLETNVYCSADFIW